MIEYRLATNNDNQQLVELTAASGMIGEISLRIDRKPDFFSLLKMRGQTKVFVALEGDTIIGFLCVSLQQVYVGEQIFPLHYVGDFKVAESFRNKGIGLQLCNELANYVVPTGADLAFLNVSKGNNKPFSFFKNRPGIPDFENIGIFKIHQFVGKKGKPLHPQYTIELSPISDEVIEFFDAHYCKYELGSVITKEKLEGTDIFAIRNKNKIIAAVCLIDTMHVKQNVVTRLSWKMKLLITVMNAISQVTGISKMPVLNEPVRMIYIKYLAVNNRDEQIVKLMINHVRNIVYERSYIFASIGLHEKDPYNKCFSGLLKVTFNSVGMLLSIKDNKTLIGKVKKGIPFQDYSLV
ncbi:GNAT family N-acetyltransferase [bacterium]|nr:MAG: GNAT family N-acetyltransferase [bacterium]